MTDVETALARLERLGNRRTRDGMARYGIVAAHAFGVSIGAIQKLAKSLGRDHHLDAALWKSGWYEARLLAAFVDDPQRVTPAQMDRWCRDFGNWAVRDTVCFTLFDRTPHAFAKVAAWRNLRPSSRAAPPAPSCPASPFTTRKRRTMRSPAAFRTSRAPRPTSATS